MKNKRIAIFAMAFLSFFLGERAATAVLFTNDTLISTGNTNFDGQAIVVSNCVLTINGTHTFADLLIANGGVVTHSATNSGLVQDYIVVSGESHPLSDAAPATLNYINIDTSSIVVTDVSGTTIYSNGVDYSINVVSGTYAEIVRLPDSAIPDGDTILVSYKTFGQIVPAGMWLTITNNLEIETGGAIHLVGKGLGGGMGTGAGLSRITNSPYSFTGGGGGGHGGYGGSSASAATGGNVYGLVYDPTGLGSGGGTGSGFGGAGGGLVRLSVGNLARIDGQITANGLRGTNSHSGGGAGGSIWMNTTTFSGSGVVSANGGSGELYNGGGGGGGRIVISYKTNSFTGDVVASGGAGWVPGGAGTIFFNPFTYGQTFGQLILDNRGRIGTNTGGYWHGYSNYDLVIKGGALLSMTNISFHHLVIGSNSWIIAPSNVALQITASGNITVQTNGGIHANAKGFSSGQGSGVGPYAGTGSAGGGYGGYGGKGAGTVLGGASYGSLSNPIDRGSGGGIGNSSSGGAGGGAVQVTVLGNLNLNGQIQANGGNGTGVNSGGGAGGSVWLTVGSLTGTGEISAEGGEGYLPTGGGGGGGRVAIYYTSNSFSGRVSARGGSGWQTGGAGTIYSKATAKPIAELLIDNRGFSGNATPISSSGLDVAVAGGAIGTNFSTLTCNSLLIGSNSWYIPGMGYTLTVTSNVVIESTGGINISGKGYTGAGAGQSVGFTGGGGGHGGYGGMGGGTNVGGGIAHGVTSGPTTTGGNGGNGGGNSPYNIGGAGGGAVRLTVIGDMILHGSIQADGFPGVGSNSGGGAGGSIYLTVRDLFGSGAITANGGSGENPLGGGGGGGRIAIYFRTNQFSGLITAHGGGGANFGGAGTIYFKPNNGSSRLITDNGGNIGAPTLLDTSSDLTVGSGANATVLSFSSLVLQNLLVKSNGMLTVTSNYNGSSLNLTVTGHATIETGGSIHLDGRGFFNGGSSATGNYNSQYGSTGGGGGHGGNGGASISGANGGNGYGYPSAPTTYGSAGASYNGAGGAGGGALRLTVTSNLTVNGSIQSNGKNGVADGSGGGAGGSLYLTAGRLLGNGLIAANGGNGEAPYGGGGGGGRIAIHYATNQFIGSLAAYGGTGAKFGGAGTIYLKANTNQTAQVLIANNGVLGAFTLYSPSNEDMSLASGAFVQLTTSSSYLNNLFIASNSWMTYTIATPFTLTLNGNATIQKGGGITLESKGYTADVSGSSGGGGSGHGGDGGASGSATGGKAYGSITAPTTVGSGGNITAVPGASGGGAIRIIASRKSFHLDGDLNANGGSALTNNAGGAAAGSIWLSVGNLSGTGTISANGGAGRLPNGCGGGGGRIAVYFDTNNFTGRLTAYGGGGSSAGGSGTIYTRVNNSSVGSIRADNGGVPGANTPLTGWTEAGGLTVSGGSTVVGVGAQSLKSLLISENSTFLLTNSQSTLNLTIFEDAIVNGIISLDAKGYSGSIGGLGAGQFTNSGSGGGHGGAGGMSASGVAGGTIYGSETAPTDFGSRGGMSPVSNADSQGGGAIRLNVGNNLSVNGKISANGKDALLDRFGGGAGGSIWITARRLFGEGIISAAGGAGEPFDGGGGGGGRIAVYAQTNLFDGVFSVAGGEGFLYGEPGTLFLSTNVPGPTVLSQTPAGSVTSVVNNVQLTFNLPINSSSVSLDDFAINSPAGPLTPTNLTFVGTTGVQVKFPSQNTLGTYEVIVGPGIESFYGGLMAQPYTNSFTISPLMISGTITDTNGLPVENVMLQPSGNFPSAFSDNDGVYTLAVSPSWTGTVVPTYEEFIFIPAARNYTNLVVNRADQNFIAAPADTLAMSSRGNGTNLNLGIFGINNVTYQAFYSTNLVNWLPFGTPIIGTNGVIDLAIPITNAPQTFFHFKLSN